MGGGGAEAAAGHLREVRRRQRGGQLRRGRLPDAAGRWQRRRQRAAAVSQVTTSTVAAPGSASHCSGCNVLLALRFRSRDGRHLSINTRLGAVPPPRQPTARARHESVYDTATSASAPAGCCLHVHHRRRRCRHRGARRARRARLMTQTIHAHQYLRLVRPATDEAGGHDTPELVFSFVQNHTSSTVSSRARQKQARTTADITRLVRRVAPPHWLAVINYGSIAL